MKGSYDSYVEQSRKISAISSSMGLLSWDQEVYMPPNGAGLRSQQLSTLSGIVHQLKTDKSYIDNIQILLEDASLNDVQKCNIREAWRSIERSSKFSKDFVETLSKTISESFAAWHKAKESSSFEIFAPHLEKLVQLKKEEAGLVGYDGHIYNALLEDYEPGMTVEQIDPLFNEIKEKLHQLVKSILAKTQNDNNFFRQNYAHELQKDFCMMLLEDMGYDMKSGRMDLAPHPFCIGFSPNDTRVTYRYKQDDLSEIIWSVTHEGGHALYEQGLNPEHSGFPAGRAVSLAIHESQSRLWENNVSRSKPYWKHYLPKLKKIFPTQLSKTDLDEFYKGCNQVGSSLIRTSADELTYHFHIMIRYEIEKGLVDGTISVNELPKIWNRMYMEYLEVEVPSDDVGVLQDVHWAHGSLGYFATYSLGSLYATQFFDAATKQITNLEDQIEQGEFAPLRQWLKEEIHQHGMQYSADELCKKVTGSSLDFSYFLNYAKQKYEEIYP